MPIGRIVHLAWIDTNQCARNDFPLYKYTIASIRVVNGGFFYSEDKVVRMDNGDVCGVVSVVVLYVVVLCVVVLCVMCCCVMVALCVL